MTASNWTRLRLLTLTRSSTDAIRKSSLRKRSTQCTQTVQSGCQTRRLPAAPSATNRSICSAASIIAARVVRSAVPSALRERAALGPLYSSKVHSRLASACVETALKDHVRQNTHRWVALWWRRTRLLISRRSRFLIAARAGLAPPD